MIQCIANGHRAAHGINKYLGVTEPHTCVGKQIQLPFLTYDEQGIKEAAGLKLKEIPKEQRNLDLEDEIAPIMEEAAKEATRCMNCGCYAVHPSDMAPVLIALDAQIKDEPARSARRGILHRRDPSQQGFGCRRSHHRHSACPNTPAA